MNDFVIELNDYCVRIHGREGPLAASPGFVHIAHGKPVFGEKAKAQSRLHPRQSFNQFWGDLSLDPLINRNDHFRHHADMAYGHLSHLAEACETSGKRAIFAVPSSYSRNQLAILLGVARQSPFEAGGLVDMAVAATAGVAVTEIALYLDIQLHQSVLTRLVMKSGRLEREVVRQIPGTGLLALHDAWANMVTDAFIKQSRFDPLHNAETEQYLYNHMNDWISEAQAANELPLEINHKGTRYQAKISLAQFEQRARPVFTRIQQELENLASSEAEVHLRGELASLPGLKASIPALRILDDNAVSTTCFDNLEYIQGDPEALSFVTALPAVHASRAKPVRETEEPVPEDQTPAPTHVLVNHKAYPLREGKLYIGGRRDNIPDDGTAFIPVNDPALGEPLIIHKQNRELRLEANGNRGLRLNNAKLEDSGRLNLGDLISVADSGIHIQLIQVQ